MLNLLISYEDIINPPTETEELRQILFLLLLNRCETNNIYF